MDYEAISDEKRMRKTRSWAGKKVFILTRQGDAPVENLRRRQKTRSE